MTSAQRVFGLMALALFPLALGACLFAVRISCFYWVQVVFAAATVVNVLILMQDMRSFLGRATAVTVVTAVMTFLAVSLAIVRLLIG